MKIGFIGVGLIGGSMLRKLAVGGVECYVFDKDDKTLTAATRQNNAKILQNFNGLDMLLISLSPRNTLDFLQNNLSKIGSTLVCDVCGVKGEIAAFAEGHGMNYCGIHPMAGKEVGGYFNSSADLFVGANVVITSQNPPQIVLDVIKMLGFGSVVYADAASHDKIISYTSQLCHIVSNAYAKNDVSGQCDGFTGGSYEDLTRVGKMDSHLWVELFMSNAKNLTADIDKIIVELQKYSACLKQNDEAALKKLIDEGSEILQKHCIS